MSPPADVLDTVLVLAEVLERLGSEHAFGGAIAQNYWGVVRATQDVDVLVSVARVRFQDMASALADVGFHMLSEDGAELPVTVESMVRQERDRHLFVVYRGLVKVEVFLPFLPLQRAILTRAAMLPFGSRTIPVTTAEDLILLKMAFHREKDLRDIRGMLWTQRGKLDLEYLRGWAEKMLADERRAELEAWIRRYAAT